MATPKPRGWWGDGPAPLAQWPGVTLGFGAKWASRRQRWESRDGQFYYDQAAADRVVEFFPTYLKHHMGHFAGQPFALLPYQEQLIVRPFFGWKYTATGLRRFRKLFAFLPKGSGKSPLGAGLGFYLAFCDGDAAAEVYAVASEKGQARVVHDQGRFMTQTMQEVDPELGRLLLVKRDEIERVDDHSKYVVLSADAASKHGFRPSAVILDEMHAQKDRNLYEVLWRSMGKRLQPAMLIFTHAGHDDEGICHEEYEYAKQVLTGLTADPSTLPVLFEAPVDADPFVEATWRKVNPGHGITIQHEAIQMLAREAQAQPRKRNDFLMWHCNRWVNQATAWIPIDWWDACRDPVPSDAELATWPCALGLDLAQKIDLACAAVVFRQRVEAAPVTVLPEEEAASTEINLNYQIAVIPFFWIPEATMREREHQDGIPYAHWVDLGLVTATEGSTIDYSRIYRDLTERIVPRFPRLKQAPFGYDPAFATDIATQLRDRAGLQVFEVLQNYQHLSEVSYIFEALVRSGRVAHGGHRVLRNHVENVAIKRDDARRVKPVKPKSTKRIDGVVATLMGLKGLATVPDEAGAAFSMFFVGGAR